MAQRTRGSGSIDRALHREEGRGVEQRAAGLEDRSAPCLQVEFLELAKVVLEVPNPWFQVTRTNPHASLA